MIIMSIEGILHESEQTTEQKKRLFRVDRIIDIAKADEKDKALVA